MSDASKQTIVLAGTRPVADRNQYPHDEPH